MPGNFRPLRKLHQQKTNTDKKPKKTVVSITAILTRCATGSCTACPSLVDGCERHPLTPFHHLLLPGKYHLVTVSTARIAALNEGKEYCFTLMLRHNVNTTRKCRGVGKHCFDTAKTHLRTLVMPPPELESSPIAPIFSELHPLRQIAIIKLPSQLSHTSIWCQAL